MRYALLADVHGNLTALEATLDTLAEHRPDAHVCAGDIVGYGPQPNECIAVLREIGAHCVAGNHELILLGTLPHEGIHPWADRTLHWTAKELTADNRAWLAALPTRLDLPDGVTVAHGSLDDTRTYVRTEELALAQLARLDNASTLVLGHTHTQMLVESGGRLLVNPGAVGQSRERRIRAFAAILDLPAASVRFIDLAYDTRATDRALAGAGLPAGTYRMRPPALRRLWLRLPKPVRRIVKRARVRR